MKARSIASNNLVETKSDVRAFGQNNGNYKKLEELTFEDLYIETPEQEFPYIKDAIWRSLVWLQTKGDTLKTDLLIFAKSTGRHHPRPIH